MTTQVHAKPTTMNNANPKPTPRPRWRFEFRLRSLFLLTALVACPLGYVMYERHRCDQQQRAESLWRGKPGFPRFRQREIRFEHGETLSDSTIAVRLGWMTSLLGDNSRDQVVGFSRHFDGASVVPNQHMYALAHLPNLKALDIRDCYIQKPGLSHVAAFHKLESLSLSGCSVTDSDLYYFSRLQQLTSLSLNRTLIGDSRMGQLAKLSKLKRLQLYQTQISDEGVKHLSKLKNLEHLDLSDTLVTEKSLDLLAQHHNLKLLALPPDSFSLKARAKIRKRLPKCDIIFAKN